MTFCIINECKTDGGTEQSVRKIYKILTNYGHNVYLIYMKIGQDESVNGYEYVLNPQLGIIDKHCYNPFLANKLKQILNMISPDVVLLNNVFSAPITVFNALRGYRVLHMVRDYAAVCPKSTCITDSGEICDGFKYRNCWLECKCRNSKLRLVLERWLLGRVDSLRLKVVSKSLPPSEMLADYLEKHGHKSSALNNPNEYDVCPPRNISQNIHKYVYLGAINSNKGVYELVLAFSHAKFFKKCELHIYGKFSDPCDEVQIMKIIESHDNIIYHGYISHEQVQSVLQNSYAIVVPSKWIENYPGTCLEGMANRLLVIASDRGGMKEQLADGRGIIFSFGVNELVEALYKAESLSEMEYQNMTDKAYRYVLNNNSYERYYERLMTEVNRIIASRHI